MTDTQQQNPGIQHLPDGRLRMKGTCGRYKDLSWNDSKQQLLVKLNCGHGAKCQHFDKCTLKSLKEPRNLLCPFHFGNSLLWCQSNRRVIPAAELKWMAVVRNTIGDADWCHQVRAPFYTGDFDFYNWRRDAYLQIDEAPHWKGMTATTHTIVSNRDFTSNLAAYNAHAAVVRVHAADIIEPTCVYAALEAAVFHHTVVLSASYSNVAWCEDGKQITYADRLQQQFGGHCKTFTDQYGNIVFLRADVLTV